MPVFSSYPGRGWSAVHHHLVLVAISALILGLALSLPVIAQDGSADEGNTAGEMWTNDITGEEMDPAEFEIKPEYLPPCLMQTSILDQAYDVIREADGVRVAEAYASGIVFTDPSQGITALNLLSLVAHVSQNDDSFNTLGAALIYRNPPGHMDNIACFQLQYIHKFCEELADVDDPEFVVPEMVRQGDATILSGEQSRLIILHPHNVPVIAATIFPEGYEDDFSHLLVFMGAYGWADFDLGEDVPEFDNAWVEDEGAREFLAQYDPAVPLAAENRLAEYTLIRQLDEAVASHLMVPAWSQIDEPSFMPAIDLMEYMLIARERDPGFTELAKELMSWSPPIGVTLNTPSVQLAITHSTCFEGEDDGMPFMVNLGDLTSLGGDVYELLIVHPRNIPLGALLVEPTEEAADCFGTVMCTYGSLCGLRD